VRYLDRASAKVPACLSRYDARTQPWEDVSWEDKEEIRAELESLQRRHCAYCECDLANESKKPHIEHFEPRSRARMKTFDWENLFLSCSQTERCGCHKDNLAGKYQSKDLVKPDLDDPRHFLQFMPDGKVLPRERLRASEAHRAEETIRVLALNDPPLVAMRRQYLEDPYRLMQEAEEAGFPAHEGRAYLEREAQDYKGSAFSAAILDVLGVAP